MRGWFGGMRIIYVSEIGTNMKICELCGELIPDTNWRKVGYTKYYHIKCYKKLEATVKDYHKPYLL